MGSGRIFDDYESQIFQEKLNMFTTLQKIFQHLYKQDMVEHFKTRLYQAL
jgi:hypothetical protein